MRHNKRNRRLSRNYSKRQSLLENLVTSLLKYQTIKTTLPKAKEAQRLAEKVIHLGKTDNVAARRQVFSYLQDRTLTTQLFRTVAPRFKDRVGGYTRILKLDKRKGDGAQLALLELTEKEIRVKAAPKKKTVSSQEKSTEADHDHGHGHDHSHDHSHDSGKPQQKGFLKNIGKFFRNKGGSN